MRRVARITGTLLVLAGVLTLGWAVLVWQWQDPVTAIYTFQEQRELSQTYERQVEAFAPPARPGASLASVRRGVETAAARYRKAIERGDAVGRLRVPRLGLDTMVANGTDDETLKRGPGRYLGSFLPGQGELVYVAGHRTTYGAPFGRIDRLRKGDRVTFELPYATFEYAVTGHRIVTATELGVLRSKGREVLALQACHPRFFATHRYIAYAKVVRISVPNGRSYTVDSQLAARRPVGS